MVDLEDYIVKQENSKSSRKLYKTSCNKCQKDRGYLRITRAKQPYCKDCFGKIVHTGKIVSEETKQKMKNSHHLRHGGTHPLLGKHHTLETKSKLSIAASLQNKTYKSKFIYKGPKGLIYMKSNWEIKYANWLDVQGQDWEYEPEFKLSNGYAYLPDFQLSHNVIIEIKGYMWPDAEVKWRMFEEEYPQIIKRLLRKEDLKKLGVLT